MTHKSHNRISMAKHELETPCLLLDTDAMERNLHKMADYFATTSAKLRPHTKTHKTPALAHMQIAAGAAGICCGNLDEAEVMIDAGIRDVLVTREIVSPSQIARVAELSKQSELIVIVDDTAIVEQYAEAALAANTEIRMLGEVDVRLGRSGVPVGEPALALSRKIFGTMGLRFMGLMGYEGSLHEHAPAERERVCRDALTQLVEARRMIERAGIPVQVVSVGATSTYTVSANFPGVSEIQAGSYLTFDAYHRHSSPGFEVALSVLTTVISRPNRTRITTDAGKKKLSEDVGLPEAKDAHVQLVALNEEHGLLDLLDASREVRVGDQLEIVPCNGGTTINLYDEMLGMRGDCVEAVFEIAARGT